MARTRGKGKSVPTTVSDLLGEVLRGKPAAQRLREGRIWEVWDAAVGKQIASRAQPVKVSDGILTVAVATAAWMQQLTFLKREICEKLNRLAREELVRDIYLKTGKIEAKRKKPAPAPASRTLTPDEEDLVNRETAAVEDPEVRLALRRLMRSHLAAR